MPITSFTQASFRVAAGARIVERPERDSHSPPVQDLRAGLCTRGGGAYAPMSATVASVHLASLRGSAQKRLLASPAAAQTLSCPSSASSNTTGSPWPNGGTPPMAKPVAARTSSAPAWRTSATSRVSASLSVSILCWPDAMQTTGSPSATNTIDLAISASRQPTATAASLTVLVEDSSCWIVSSSPSSLALSATLAFTALRLEGRARFRAPSQRPFGLAELHSGGLGQLSQSGANVLGQLIDVPEQVIVAHEAEVEPAVVAH